jgi:hypothetical protein
MYELFAVAVTAAAKYRLEHYQQQRQHSQRKPESQTTEALVVLPKALTASSL